MAIILVMMTAVRQTVTVQADGRLELIAPELAEGTVTEVIVLVPEDAPKVLTPQERIAELEALRAKVNLTEEQAAKWIKEVRLERQAWRRPSDPEAT